MNILRYMTSRGYRDKFYEEYSKEFINSFELPEQEYEKVYNKLQNGKSADSI